MGVSLQSGSADGKKAVDAELNLVPFIDLLVCCICFLLITAVWTQMAQVDVQQQTPGAKSTAPVKSAVAKRVSLLIGEEGYVLALGGEHRTIPKLGSAYDTARLDRVLARLRASLGSEAAPVRVEVEDGVSYRQIVEAIDVTRRHRFGAVSVHSSS